MQLGCLEEARKLSVHSLFMSVLVNLLHSHFPYPDYLLLIGEQISPWLKFILPA